MNKKIKFLLRMSFLIAFISITNAVFPEDTSDEFFSLRFGYVYGYAKADFYGELHKTPLSGVKFGIYKGYFSKSHPNLEYGISISYFIFNNRFNLTPDLNPLPEQVTTMPFELNVRLEGLLLMACGGYSIQIRNVKIGSILEIGIARLFEEINWEIITTSTPIDGLVWTDVTRATFKVLLFVQYKITERIYCGIYSSTMPFPLRTRLVHDESNSEISLWKMESIFGFGIVLTLF
ncbi:MAG: hypothetical protein N2316_00700 [Spirochaetes bacterium]|nr:hypothetical protein [Spirochaetota bacterium]